MAKKYNVNVILIIVVAIIVGVGSLYCWMKFQRETAQNIQLDPSKFRGGRPGER